MGYGTTRSLERVLASCGMLVAADLKFVCAQDVPQAGVLCALPALLTEGLLRHTRSLYSLPAGYYPLESIFLYLALLALVRCPSLEQTRYQAPGEWGKILGLDRLPEVKTLREKVGIFCEQEGRATQWQSRLAQDWMLAVGEGDPQKEGVGLFYVDGHVCGSIMGAWDRCRASMWRDKNCSCGARPIIGSTAWAGNLSSSSPNPFTRA